jgi:hypothetical protein
MTEQETAAQPSLAVNSKHRRIREHNLFDSLLSCRRLYPTDGGFYGCRKLQDWSSPMLIFDYSHNQTVRF